MKKFTLSFLSAFVALCMFFTVPISVSAEFEPAGGNYADLSAFATVYDSLNGELDPSHPDFDGSLYEGDEGIKKIALNAVDKDLSTSWQSTLMSHTNHDGYYTIDEELHIGVKFYSEININKLVLVWDRGSRPTFDESSGVYGCAVLAYDAALGEYTDVECVISRNEDDDPVIDTVSIVGGVMTSDIRVLITSGMGMNSDGDDAKYSPELKELELYRTNSPVAVSRRLVEGGEPAAINEACFSGFSDSSEGSGPYTGGESGPSNAFDHDMSTAWQFDSMPSHSDGDGYYLLDDPIFLGVSFSAEQTVSGITLYWETNVAPTESGFYAQALNAQTGLYENIDAVVSRSEENGVTTDTLIFNGYVTAAALRIMITNGISDKYAPKIYEFEISTAQIYSDLRLIAAVDSLDYYKTGFEIEIFRDSESTESSVKAYSDPYVYSEIDSFMPADFGSGFYYLSCLIITDIPSDAHLRVRGFSVSSDGASRFYGPWTDIVIRFGQMTVNEKAESSYVEVDTHYLDSVLGDAVTLKALNGADHLVDNSGMSGLWSGNHLHAGFSKQSYINESMYLTSSTSGIVFDAGNVQALGKMFIWNYNDVNHLDYGMRTIEVYYSTDNEHWNLFGDRFTLAPCSEDDNTAYGGNTSTNLYGSNQPIDFKGLSARYIKIVPITSWSGGNQYGLSEVRVFRHKTTPAKGDLIYPYSFAPQNYDTPYYTDASNVTNNSGMSTSVFDANATHSNNAADMWLSLDTAAKSVLVLDLDGNYPVDKLTLWNYNASGAEQNGIKTFSVYYSTSNPFNIVTPGNDQDEYIDWSQGSWTRIGGTYTLPMANGSDSMPASLTINLNNVHAQFIKIVPATNYAGTSTGFGLSEVRVTCGSGWLVEPSRYWTGVLSSSGSFKYQGNNASDPFASRNQGYGWIAGDGCFSSSLTGDTNQGDVNSESKTLITFQDSFMGNFGNYRSFRYTKGYSSSSGFRVDHMKNMAYLFIKGDTPDVRNVRFYNELNNGLSNNHSARNIFPNSHYNRGYWTGDSTTIDGYVYSIAACVGNTGWSVNYRYLLRQPLGSDGFPNMSIKPEIVVGNTGSQIINNTEYATGANYVFDNEYFSADQIFEGNDGYLYLVGKKRGTGWLTEGQYMVIARIPVESYSSLSDVTYWNGTNWTVTMSAAASISRCTPGNEFNIAYCRDGYFAGKYVAIYIDGSIGGTMKFAVSDSITGMFSNGTTMYYAPAIYMASYRSYTREAYAADTSSDKPSYYRVFRQWNYNGKAQAALSKSGELLATYHFGTYDDNVPSNQNKDYEHPTFISIQAVKEK